MGKGGSAKQAGAVTGKEKVAGGRSLRFGPDAEKAIGHEKHKNWCWRNLPCHRESGVAGVAIQPVSRWIASSLLLLAMTSCATIRKLPHATPRCSRAPMGAMDAPTE